MTDMLETANSEKTSIQTRNGYGTTLAAVTYFPPVSPSRPPTRRSWCPIPVAG